jgi:hypothetical protein
MRTKLGGIVRDRAVAEYLVGTGLLGGLFPTFVAGAFIWASPPRRAPGIVALGGAGQFWLLAAAFTATAIPSLMRARNVTGVGAVYGLGGLIFILLACGLIWGLQSQDALSKNFDPELGDRVLSWVGVIVALAALSLGALASRSEVAK